MEPRPFAPRAPRPAVPAPDVRPGLPGWYRPIRTAAPGLFALGLVLAVLTDGSLPEPWRGTLFGALTVLDALLIDRLVRGS